MGKEVQLKHLKSGLLPQRELFEISSPEKENFVSPVQIYCIPASKVREEVKEMECCK